MIVRWRGFSLIELMLVLVLLAILALLASPMLEGAARRQKEAELRQALVDIRGGLDAYREAARAGLVRSPTGSGYPGALSWLTGAGGANGRVFLRAIPRDPMAPDTIRDSVASWGLRAYGSPPDQPKAGADVFDVYSMAPGSGSDGVPYREW